MSGPALLALGFSFLARQLRADPPLRLHVDLASLASSPCVTSGSVYFDHYECTSKSHHTVERDSGSSLDSDVWSTRITGRFGAGPTLFDVMINSSIGPSLDDAVQQAFQDAHLAVAAAAGSSSPVSDPILLSSSTQAVTGHYLPTFTSVSPLTSVLTAASPPAPATETVCVGDLGEMPYPPSSLPNGPCSMNAVPLTLRGYEVVHIFGGPFTAWIPYDDVRSMHTHSLREVYPNAYITGTLTTSHYEIVAEGTTVTRVVPIVLDVTTDTARYTTELTLTNDTPDAVAVSALYTPALGSKSGNGTVTDNLGPGEQRRIPDVLSWLRLKGLGLPLPSVDSSQGGTLKLDFTGPNVEPTRVWALARTGSDTRPPQPIGRSGVAYAAPLASEGASRQGVAGLRSSATDRSNLAIVNLSDQPVSFEVNLQSLAGSYVVFPERGGALNLPPWGWMQIDSAELLDANGIHDGYAYGSGPDGSRLYLYSVINDRVTNDGSFLAPIDGCGATAAAFPAVETFGFTTELTLINLGYQGTTFQLNYVESASPGMGVGGGANESSDAFSQTIYPNIFNLLRDSYVRVGPFGAAGYAGVLSVNPLFGGLAMERVLSPSPAGGAFGVALPGACLTNAATDRAAVYGLVSNDTNRSNVAVFSLEGSVTLRLDVHDGLAGGAVRGAPVTISLGPSEWRQVNGILRNAGVAEGWVEVTRTSGTAGWFAYGVVNDGAYPGQRTGDGAYVPMSK